MRIALVAGPYVPVPPRKYGGTELIIDYLIRGLKEEGHEPILLGPGDSSADCELVPIIDKAIYFPASKSNMPEHDKLVEQACRTTDRKLRELLPRIDMIHSHGFDLQKFQDFPNLTTLHDPIEFAHFSYYMERQKLYFASISQNQQGALPDLQYVGVVYNGEDPDAFPIVTKPEDYICFLGRFDRDKNPHLAIQLAVNLGIKIKLAGKMDFKAEGYFDDEIKPYLNHPLVEYLGEIDFKKKVGLLSRAKCNLHPTGFREPFGLDVLEAAYCGTPTLAIARGSMPELIEEGRTGMLVEDFVEGFHQIKQCFEMDRNYIAGRARLLFNYRVMAKQYLAAYQRVVDIFNTRYAQDSLIRQLTAEAQADLFSIWRSESNRPPQLK